MYIYLLYIYTYIYVYMYICERVCEYTFVLFVTISLLPQESVLLHSDLPQIPQGPSADVRTYFACGLSSATDRTRARTRTRYMSFIQC